MSSIIKMSVIQGSGLNGSWGLVRQMGPWKPTRRDRVGAGYTNTNHDVVRPYVVRGDKPQPKLSKWGQNSVVSKKAYRPGISRIGMKTDSVGSILKGIHHTLLGIGARGSGTGVDQGRDQVDNNGNGNQGNGNGDEDADEDSSSPVSSDEIVKEEVKEEKVEEEFFDAVGGENVQKPTRSYGLFPGHVNTLYTPKPQRPEMIEVKRYRGKNIGF